MANLKIMSNEEKREILKEINERFGIPINVFDDYVFVKSNKKVWIFGKEASEKNFSGLFVECFGMLFARLDKGRVKPTTNAAQIFGKYATKNVVEIGEAEMYDVLRGLNLYDFECDAKDGYVLLKYKEHILGVGLKQGKFIKNMIPKARRIKKF